jgi:hypothetical protein
VAPLLKPWQFMPLTLAGWIKRSQQEAIEYLRAENQVLAGQLKGKRLRLYRRTAPEVGHSRQGRPVRKTDRSRCFLRRSIGSVAR